ncbi:MAG TPA: hypothetical protein VMM92_05490 [Thermoanaerobaculia bacterium]|nr:hypothetical protein [Thermoanaerobaculia bacterium]
MREALPRLAAYAAASVVDVEDQLRRAARKTVASCERKSSAGSAPNARTLWQLVQGGTALARKIPHADERVTLERRASRLLAAVA